MKSRHARLFMPITEGKFPVPDPGLPSKNCCLTKLSVFSDGVTGAYAQLGDWWRVVVD